MRFIRGFVIAASYVLIFLGSAQAQSVTIGETAVLSSGDSGNGNLLAAQSANLAQAATIQSLSFYVTTASGSLILGIYDATGPNGGPGALKASTTSFTPKTGWNTANVVTPVSLAAGSYWLAYLPSSNALSFVKTNASGNCAYYGYNFGSLPSKYSTSPASCTPATWSFYATLTGAQSVTIGETAVLSSGDSGNGNLLAAQSANLAQAATIQSLSFYVTTASGSLILGIYDATGPNGGPGALKASTTSFTPKTGWNTANVVTPVSLAAGSYWLAYLPSSNALSFMKTNASGNCAFYGYNFGSLPSKYSTSPNSCTPATWSLYATLTLSNPLNGACGSSNGADLTSTPTANLCSAGAASSVNGSGPWNWTCAGSGGGTTASCSSLYEINGACGSSNGVSLASAPTSNLCSGGSASTVAGSGPWNWSCVGSNGGTTATCSAQASATPVNGSCGSSNGADLTSKPTTNLCGAGTASTVTGSGPWSWSCAGSNGGTSATCSAVDPPAPVSGACGSANGVAVSTAPTNNLCSAGTASTVAGSGPWSWSCAGSNGGATASCSDSLASTGSSGSGGSDPTSGVLPSYDDAYANWKNAGLATVGGIPTRTTQCGSTLTPSGGDDATQIQNAINACTPGQVVQLGAGTFQITLSQADTIFINQGITLRGTGNCTNASSPYCETVLTVSNGLLPTYVGGGGQCGTSVGSAGTCSAAWGAIFMGPTTNAYFPSWNGCPKSANETGCAPSLAADAAQGATTVQVSATSSLSVGDWVRIDEASAAVTQPSPINSGNIFAAPDLFASSGSPATGKIEYAGSGVEDGAAYGALYDRETSEIHHISAIGPGPCPGANCTITFDSPLTIAYRQSGSHHAQVYEPWNNGSQTKFLQEAGLENITITRSLNPITMFYCAYCWIKNVEIADWENGLIISNSARSLVTHTYLHDCSDCENNGSEYPLAIDGASTENLITDNIIRLSGKGMVGRSSGGGNVVSYNYQDDMFYMGSVIGNWWIELSLNGSHYTGSHHTLFEGNLAVDCDDDNTHGNVVYHTFFRNWCMGLRTPFTDPSLSTSTSSTHDPSQAGENDYTGVAYATDATPHYPYTPGPRRTAGMMGMDYWMAYVGNVLGVSGATTAANGWTYAGYTLSDKVIWMLGWDAGADTANPDKYLNGTKGSYFFRHGDYDYLNNSIADWATGYSHTLPQSFYLSSAPSFFGASGAHCTYAWPWVTPTGSSPLQTPTGSGCASTDGLPARARWDAGTPFVQP